MDISRSIPGFCLRKIKGHLLSRMSRTAEMIKAVGNALLGAFQDLNVKWS